MRKTTQSPGEKIVKDIKRATRKQYSSEEKIRITPEAAFSVNDWSILVIFIVGIGGIGTLEGPIIGCILFFVLREFLADLGSWYMIILGLISVAIMLLKPRGLWSMLTRNRNLTLFPTTRQIGHSP
ncbi:MAG: hypothetical protein ABJJ03_11305 [Sulfitobacter sp.]